MNLTVEIPADLAIQLSATAGDLSRRALEAFALEEYKADTSARPDCAAFWALHPLMSSTDF
jgi:hypothetical protein